jgi:hypothetical protein
MNYDDIIEQKFTKALSECLGIDEEIIELLDIKLDNDYGNSSEKCFYGYYVEIPKWDDLDKSIQEQIPDEIKNEIEWGKTKYISESKFGNTTADPFNWKADYEYEYYCITHSTQKKDVLFILKELKNKIEESKDELIIKSLILCAFSITESFVRNIVWSHIPDIENQNIDNKLKEILKQKMYDDINNSRKRREVYKKFTNKNLLPIPFFKPVRHSLAHDIPSVSISADTLFIDSCEQEFSINTIMNELIKYVDILE